METSSSLWPPDAPALALGPGPESGSESPLFPAVSPSLLFEPKSALEPGVEVGSGLLSPVEVAEVSPAAQH